MKSLGRIITLPVALALTTETQAEQKFERLTVAQIEARLVGMELTDEAHWDETFGRNGADDHLDGPQERGQMARPKGPALSGDRRRTGRRLLRGLDHDRLSWFLPCIYPASAAAGGRHRRNQGFHSRAGSGPI